MSTTWKSFREALDAKIRKVFKSRDGTSGAALIGLLALAAHGILGARTIEFDTNEVTQPGITTTPGGRSIGALV
jgi:hypothetical protein